MSETNGTTPAPESASTTEGLALLEQPDWMDPGTWEQVRADSLAFFANAVAEHADPTYPVPCTERSWCVVADEFEHEDHHASEGVPLAGFDREADLGWSAHIVERRGRRPRVSLEGVLVIDGKRKVMATEVDATRAVLLLWATETAAAHAKLDGLISRLADQ